MLSQPSEGGDKPMQSGDLGQAAAMERESSEDALRREVLDLKAQCQAERRKKEQLGEELKQSREQNVIVVGSPTTCTALPCLALVLPCPALPLPCPALPCLAPALPCPCPAPVLPCTAAVC